MELLLPPALYKFYETIILPIVVISTALHGFRLGQRVDYMKSKMSG
jgi:hypothetical protein